MNLVSRFGRPGSFVAGRAGGQTDRPNDRQFFMQGERREPVGVPTEACRPIGWAITH